MNEYLQYIICFSLFVILQSFFINGWHQSFKEGFIFSPVRLWIKEYIGEYLSRPLFECIRCEASIIGSVTFWITVLPLFGFNAYEIWVCIADIFILVSANWLIYKKI